MATGFYNNAGTDIGDFFEGGTGNQTFGYKVSDGSDIGSLYLNKSEGTAGDSVGFKNSSGTDIGTLLCKKGTNGIKYGPFTIPSNSVKAPTGRYYYRHSSGMGSVMCWCDRGTYRRTLVLDKQYCSNRSWASVYGSNTDISGIANYTSGVAGWGTAALRIDSGMNSYFAGQVQATSFKSTSDRNLKENISKITNDIDLSSLRACAYNFKDDPTKEHKIGLIAQDVQKIIPEAVSNSEGHLVLDYNAIVSILINKVNDLQARLTSIENSRIENKYSNLLN